MGWDDHIHVLFFHHQLQNWLLAPSGRFLPSPAALLCSPWGVPVSRGCILCLSVLNLVFRYNCSFLAFLTAAAWQNSMNFYKLFMNLFLLNVKKKKPIKINMLGAVIRGLCYLLQLVAWCCKLSRQWGCLEGWNQFSGEQFSGLVLVYKLLTFLKKFTLWCLMGSLEKGQGHLKLIQSWLTRTQQVEPSVPKVDALESEKPAVQPGNVKTACVRRLCFQGLITAF